MLNTFDRDSTNYEWENLLSYVLYKTGLRVNEAIEAADRWQWFSIGQDIGIQVDLSKFEAVRSYIIEPEVIPYFERFFFLRDYIFGTYASYNHWLKKRMPKITINSDVRRSTSHLFRYNYIKHLHVSGYTDSEIREEIKHASQSSTDRYIYDKIYLHTL